MGTARARGQRAGLTRDAVLAAARDQIAEHGLAAMTMRAIAARLGVAPNALYHHAPGKEALVDDLLDRVLEPVRPPWPPPADPAARVEALLVATYDALLAAPDLVPLFLTRRRRSGPHADRLTAETLTAIGEAGRTGADATEALRALIVYTFGFAAVAGRPTADPGGSAPLPAERLRENYVHGLRWLLTGALGR
ncbi:MAG TPA: helix-turn-helix domain-containing protein [Pilimelia sp.]|nr:helix-turn-helix domain-containing protein [Pilimelia sp.]